MIVGVPKESYPGERRVALIPATAAQLIKAGLEVAVETSAGQSAGFPDAAYEEAGARIQASRAEIFSSADVILQIRAGGANSERGAEDFERMRPDQTIIGFLNPLQALEPAVAMAERGVAAFAMELIPRISRAQSMDALSSMATVSGYKAVLLAAEALPRMFPMLMTAAGTITPARVFVIGAGVAGLQALATARRLGARTEAFDVRSAVKEQVESVGAKFVELALESDAQTKDGYAQEHGEDFYRRQRELMTSVLAESDVVITTAAVPGKTAPKLITAEMVGGMQPGSVIMDLAAEQGGNCELTRPGETINERGVTIIGTVNVPSTVPYHASQLFAKNITTFLLHLLEDGKLQIDSADEIIEATRVMAGGEIVHPAVRELMGLDPVSQSA